MATQAIVVIHNRTNRRWLYDLLDSIDTHYPIIITNHNGWCMTAIEKVYNETDYDEYLILNESMKVKDNALFDICFQEYEGQQVKLGERFLMFFGKFLRQNMFPFPEVKTKVDDVLRGEGQWCARMDSLPHVSLQPLADDKDKITEIDGEKVMVLENDYIIKYKRHWDIDMI